MFWDIGKLNKGKSLTSDVKRKISLKKKQLYKEGKLKLPDNRGKKPWNKGIPRSDKEKKVMSEAVSNQFKQGRKPWNVGISRTVKERQSISTSLKEMWKKRKDNNKKQ